MIETDIEIKRKERKLLKEMNLLAAKRLIKPNLEYSRRMNAIFHELYELTGNSNYLL